MSHVCCRCDEQCVFYLWYDLLGNLFNTTGYIHCAIIYRVEIDNKVYVFYADIYGDLISRQVHTSDAEKFAEVCPCPCNGVGWGVIWCVFFSFIVT